jgi:hypothetical protein
LTPVVFTGDLASPDSKKGFKLLGSRSIGVPGFTYEQSRVN